MFKCGFVRSNLFFAMEVGLLVGSVRQTARREPPIDPHLVAAGGLEPPTQRL
jgi:hypothetical protein